MLEGIQDSGANPDTSTISTVTWEPIVSVLLGGVLGSTGV